MKCWINYTTFSRDLGWLNFSLQSLKKYGKGFSGVTIAVPAHEAYQFLPLEKTFSTKDCPVTVKTFMEYPERGFLHHLAMKCYADTLAPEATHILHMDPDCLFSAPVTPQDYVVDGKPVLVIESYDLLRKYFENRAFWKIGVDDTLGIDAKFETMCRHPSIHLPETYVGVRARVESIHKTPFIDYYLKGKNSFPQTRSEFPVLGAYAVEFLADKYHLIDCTKEREARLDELMKDRDLPIGHPKPLLTQFWSYRGTAESMHKIKKILK